MSLDLLFSSLSSSPHFLFLLSLSLSLSLSPCVVVVVVVSCVYVFVVVVCACGVVWCGTLKTPVFQYVPVCTGTTPASGNTCGRGAGTHGDVSNVHTGGVLNVHREEWGGEGGGGDQRDTPTPTPTHTHTNTHTLHSNSTYNAQSTTQNTQSVIASYACQNLPT